MSELNELYQQVILDHNKHPKNFRELPGADFVSEGFNPLCGDHLHLYVKLDGDVISEVTFTGSGCAISKASASMMTAAVKGKKKSDVEQLFHEFHDMVNGREGASTEHLGKLMVFAGVREYPARVKCASLAWHTLYGALHQEGTVSTEEK